MTQTPVRIGWFIVSSGLVVLIGYGIQREQFTTLITGYGLLNWGYWLRVRLLWQSPLPAPEMAPPMLVSPDVFLFGSAVFFRLLLLGVTPNLSDDYARFVWDGRLLAHGFNPYLYLPADLIGSPIAAQAGLTQPLFDVLNSPRYFTVYPPVNQAIFAVSAWLSPDSVWGTVVWLRVWIIGAEVGTLWLMVKILQVSGRNPNLALLYGLNPLVILELTGNVHFEGVMVFFGLLAVWFWGRQKRVFSAGALALAVGTKLLPLMALPLVLRWSGRTPPGSRIAGPRSGDPGRPSATAGLIYVAWVMGLTVCLFLPFASVALVQHLGASLNLYVRKFEFNGSVYNLVRATEHWLNGYNKVQHMGLWLSGLTVPGILVLALSSNRRMADSFANWLLLTGSLYFGLATTVHPWYIGSLVALSVFSRYRFALVWSGMAWLSYSAYRTIPVAENLWLIGLEYLVVAGVGVYELRQGRKK